MLQGLPPQARLALSAQLPHPALGSSSGSGGKPPLQGRPPGGQVQGRVVGGVVRLCPRALLQQQGDHARVPARRRQVQRRAPVCGGGAAARLAIRSSGQGRTLGGSRARPGMRAPAAPHVQGQRGSSSRGGSQRCPHPARRRPPRPPGSAGSARPARARRRQQSAAARGPACLWHRAQHPSPPPPPPVPANRLIGVPRCMRVCVHQGWRADGQGESGGRRPAGRAGGRKPGTRLVASHLPGSHGRPPPAAVRCASSERGTA